jgi:hypothetical protein
MDFACLPEKLLPLASDGCSLPTQFFTFEGGKKGYTQIPYMQKTPQCTRFFG